MRDVDRVTDVVMDGPFRIECRGLCISGEKGDETRWKPPQNLSKRGQGSAMVQKKKKKDIPGPDLHAGIRGDGWFYKMLN